VGLRFVHSIWQTLVHVTSVRFLIFLLATACLIALAINAVRATI